MCTSAGNFHGDSCDPVLSKQGPPHPKCPVQLSQPSNLAHAQMHSNTAVMHQLHQWLTRSPLWHPNSQPSSWWVQALCALPPSKAARPQSHPSQRLPPRTPLSPLPWAEATTLCTKRSVFDALMSRPRVSALRPLCVVSLSSAWHLLWVLQCQWPFHVRCCLRISLAAAVTRRGLARVAMPLCTKRGQWTARLWR